MDKAESMDLIEQYLTETRGRIDQSVKEAERLTNAGNYTAALVALSPALEELNGFPAPEESVWMDFHSFLDGLVYQDYFSDELGVREIARHPLRPARMLRAKAAALDGLGRTAEAAEALEALTKLDPVCPEYICALCEAYLHTGRAEEAWAGGCWALMCASAPEEAARCYLLLARCLAQRDSWDNAAILLQKSLRVFPSAEAENALASLARRKGLIQQHTDDEINRRCRELEVPTGISEVVERNLEFLRSYAAHHQAGRTDG